MDGLDARVLAAVTRRGRRLLTVSEILEEGATYAQIVDRVNAGIWQRVHDAVVLIGAGALTWEEEVLAATQAGGETAGACRRAAARLHRIGEYGRRLVEIAVTHGTEIHAEGVLVHRTRRLTPLVMVDGIPCTSVEETLLDLAAILPARLVHQAMTTAWRTKLTTPKKVLGHIEHYGGRGVKGTRKLRNIAKLYDECDRGPGSEAEADLLWQLFERLEAAGIECPMMQGVIKVDRGRRDLSVDLLWKKRTKVVEMMGLSAHGDYIRQDEDTVRGALIRDAGYDLREVTPRAVRERPHETIAEIVRWLQTPNLTTGLGG
jgi:hypothetical protein